MFLSHLETNQLHPCANATHFLYRFELDPAERASAENDRQPEQDDSNRHERRAGDVSEQDEEDRDDGEDCGDVVVHNFLSWVLQMLSCEAFSEQDS